MESEFGFNKEVTRILWINKKLKLSMKPVKTGKNNFEHKIRGKITVESFNWKNDGEIVVKKNPNQFYGKFAGNRKENYKIKNLSKFK